MGKFTSFYVDCTKQWGYGFHPEMTTNGKGSAGYVAECKRIRNAAKDYELVENSNFRNPFCEEIVWIRKIGRNGGSEWLNCCLSQNGGKPECSIFTTQMSDWGSPEKKLVDTKECNLIPNGSKKMRCTVNLMAKYLKYFVKKGLKKAAQLLVPGFNSCAKCKIYDYRMGKNVCVVSGTSKQCIQMGKEGELYSPNSRKVFLLQIPLPLLVSVPAWEHVRRESHHTRLRGNKATTSSYSSRSLRDPVMIQHTHPEPQSFF